MKKRDVRQEILEGLQAIKKGKGIRIKVNPQPDAAALRRKLKLSQFFKVAMFFCFWIVVFVTVFAGRWVDKSGKAISDSPSQKSSENFIEQLIIT
ncbi:MAG: hypothetical protein IIA62_06635, partial [Nitrospinae bacterium]|nr:hypothetical protein [Nitrospinota bacterium]